MNHDKKQIIINEIDYWKKNKLLPETYCNFLLAIYTEGDESDESISYQKDLQTYRVTIVQSLLYGLVIFILFATLYVIYFTELSLVLQIGLVCFFLTTSIGVTAYFIRKQGFFQVPLSITLLHLFIGSITMVELLGNDKSFLLGLIVVCNSLLWTGIGYFYRQIYLLISGIVGLIIFILTILI